MNRLYTLLLIPAFILYPAIACAFTVFDGSGNGEIIENRFGEPRGTPLLDGFRFRFGPPWNQRSNTDHHLRTIRIRPGQPTKAGLTVAYHDDATPPFSYRASFHSRQSVHRAQVNSGSGVCHQRCLHDLARPNLDDVFVIVGFEFSMSALNDDIHLEEIMVLEDEGVLTVAFEGDEPGRGLDVFYTYEIDYAYVPIEGIQAMGTEYDIASTNKDGLAENDTHYIAPGNSVIRGFDLRFKNGNHHVREIGVETPDHLFEGGGVQQRKVKVFFNDENQDDAFSWVVKWATLKPEVQVIRAPISP